MHGLAITGNNMLYYEKQFTLLQIMSQKRTCRIHVPFDRGNKVITVIMREMTPRPTFRASLLRNQEGTNTNQCGACKLSTTSFQKPYFSTVALYWLWRN